MLVRCKCFSEEISRRSFLDQIRRCGGDAARFRLEPWASGEAYASVFDDVDVILNSFPFHLATNMCDALLAGVPVVSCIGEEHRSRMGLSIASAAGLSHYCGDSVAATIDAATRAIEDVNRLGHEAIALKVAASDLMDSAGFAKRFIAAAEACIAGV